MKKSLKTAGAAALAFLLAAALCCAISGYLVLAHPDEAGLEADSASGQTGKEVAEEAAGEVILVLFGAVFLALLGPALLLTGLMLIIFFAVSAAAFARRRKGSPAGGAETFAIMGGVLYAVWGALLAVFSFGVPAGIVSGAFVCVSGLLAVVYGALCKRNPAEPPEDGYYNLPPEDPGPAGIPEQEPEKSSDYEPLYCWGRDGEDPF